ncbi:MAG: phosphatase PAP2 family protein [Idiomarina sp.]
MHIKWLGRIQSWDEQTFFLLSTKQAQRWCRQWPRWLSRTGDGYAYILACVAALLLQDPDAAILSVTLLLGFLLELPLYWLLKNTLRRQRPYQRIPRFKSQIIAHDTFSFPSGHTTAAFMFAGLCANFMPSLGPLVYTWAALVGLSRVLLGVHFPTDIVAGALLGSALAALILVQTAGWW